MTIQDWGAIGEILGAIGVIATLIYLSTQIRQNNRSLHEATSSAINQSLANLNSRLSTDAEFAEIFMRGRQSIDNLDAIELERFRTFVMDLMNLAVYQDGLQGSHKVEPLHYDMVAIAGGYYQSYPGMRVIMDSVEDVTPRNLVERFRGMEPVGIIENDNVE